MAIDDAFQASTDAVLLDMAQRPRPPVKQAPAFSVWGFLTAAPKGVAAGISQAAGSAADVFGAAAQVSGSLGTEDWVLPDPVKAARDTEEARRKLREQGGPDLNSEVGRSLRNVSRDYMPDPVTAHGAEQAVANLFRVGVKAVGAGAVLGPLAGAAVVGAEEGLSTADDLREKGVDWETRTKVGAVTAGFTGVGLALPVAGQTWASTVGLAVAGGPASFIGQNAATREILKNANYADIANQYDPFDPVGLTLSTLLPLGFGALAMRGARGAKAGEAALPGEVPVNEPHTGAPRPDADAVDAARVNLLRENIDNTRPTPPEDLAGAAAHDAALSRAVDQLAAGERVAVSDLAPAGTLARIADDLDARLTRVLDEVIPAMRTAEAAPVSTLDAAVADASSSAPRAAAESVAPANASTVIAQRGEAGATTQPRLVSEAPEVDRAVNILEAERPDLMVHLDGMEAPVRLGDLMQQVRNDLTRDLQEAPLIEAAAACFLSTGG